MEIRQNLQDTFLNQARKDRVPLTVFLTNGFQQHGTVYAFDGYTVMLYNENRQYLIYKHAISTMIPQSNLELPHD